MTHHPVSRQTFGAALAATLLALVTLLALAPPAAAATGSEEPQNVLQIIMHGGPLIMAVWITILGTSIVMVTLVIQNAILLRNAKLVPPALYDALSNSISAGNYQEAWETCKANRNYLANVLQGTLERIGRGKAAVEDAVAAYSLREAQIIRTRNSYLSVIGVVAPMIGLLGTVIGMIKAFASLGAAGLSDPRGLATAISEVLLATASGLFIAIPAFIAYYIFRNRAQLVIVYADDKVNHLLAGIPYDELAGVQIGENFTPGGMPAPGTSGGSASAARSAKVSVALTTNCPICNGAITPGQNPCPHCGATLDWAG